MQENNEYGASRQRELAWHSANGGIITWYVWGGSSVIAEYDGNFDANIPLAWRKSYIYAGSRLLSTFTKNNSNGETLEFHHPDRLGSKVITNNAANTSFEQSTLPFGTALDAETTGTTNQRFTSYDRSTVAQLDYAVNRSYSAGQGRFTSVDPIGMSAASLGNPQSLNMYAYVENNPIDFTDPSGLFMIGEGRRRESQPDLSGLLSLILGSRERQVEQPFIDDTEGAGGGGTTAPPAQQPKKDNCKFPIYDQLSQAQKDVLGNNAENFNNLKPRAKANFLNITGGAAAIGLNLTGIVANNIAGQTDRLIFAGTNASRLEGRFAVAQTAGTFSNSPPADSQHPGQSDWGGRQKVSRNSMQVGGGRNGQGTSSAFLDIDYFNPQKNFLGHALEVIYNKAGNNETNPYRVGRGLGRKITGYTCKKVNPEE